MRWEAANVKKRTRSDGERRDDSQAKSSETVEAALARLTRAYSAAMTCIGSLHRLASLSEIDEASLESLQRVANAARTTLERVVLIDPLVADTCAPTWHDVVNEHASDERWAFVQDVRPPPVLLSSSSHRSAVRELAYLSLVNYADLLLQACPTTAQGDGIGILDRGVVTRVPSLTWKDVSVEFNRRLALAALCDASELDGSDPTVWLKLACAARSLSGPHGSYDRLERHALERGRTALPPDVPPNRLVVRALTEHCQEKESVQVYPSKLHTQEATAPIVLDLPRYSWSMLGRMLLRACREGSAYRSHYYSSSTDIPQRKQFGSPSVTLNLSPMLVLPPQSLGIICQYLDHASVWKFEATCRGLSASILQARASMERQEATNTAEGKKGEPSNETQTTLDPPDETANLGTSIGGSQDPTINQDNSVELQPKNEEQTARSHRTSKRVQSQLITSGKLAERKAKRNSVDFCFLAAILGCSRDDEAYQSMLKEKINWDENVPGGLRMRSMTHSDPSLSKMGPKQVRDTDFRARLGEASLTTFVEQWSSNNSGPMDVLSHYLRHVSMNVEEAFAVDPESAEVLSSCIVECIDTLSLRCGFRQGWNPSWYGSKAIPSIENVKECIEVFAVNLLNAELRLSKCERVTFSNNAYDDDGNVVAAMVPELLRGMNDMEMRFQELAEDRKWFALKSRLHWLAAGFYLWWSRSSHNFAESRQAESHGMEHVDEAIQSLKMPREHPIHSVRTPHLESSGRSEKHWKILSESSLSSFREERQAASVVSRARELFIEKAGLIERRMAIAGDEHDGCELNDDEKAALSEISSDLSDRYHIPFEEGTSGRLQELIDDFLEMNGQALTQGLNGERENGQTPLNQWDRVWDLIPSQLPRRDELLPSINPSILSVLSICMHAREGNQLFLLLLLSRVSLAAYDHIRYILHKTSGTLFKDEALRDDGDFSDSEDSFASNDAEAKTGKGDDDSRVRLYGRMIQFFLDKILDIFEKNVTKEDLSTYVASQECLSLVHSSMAFSSELDRYSDRNMTNWATVVLIAPLDLMIYLSTQKLVRSLMKSGAVEGQKRALESVYFHGLARIFVEQSQTLPSILQPSGSKRWGRALRQKVCLNRAEYIGAVAGEMASMMSRNRADLQSGQIIASYLVHFLNGSQIEESPVKSTSLVSICESVLWFWKYMTSQTSDEGHSVRVHGSTSVASFDRPVIEVLYAPIASLIVGLCGSAITTRSMISEETFGLLKGYDSLCVGEFYDSDSSTTELFLDAEDENVCSSGAKRAQTEILRAICQAIHCLALVSCDVNATFAISHRPPTEDERQHGPLLALVVCRVANHFADLLLTEFGAEQFPAIRRKNLWATDYPFGARAIGGLLDSTLYKAYHALHGILLAGPTAQQAVAGMDHLFLSSPNDDIRQEEVVVPESTLAAAQLYRCIMRAYGTGRKSPPRAALECVASALPDIEESKRSKVLRNFLFSGESEHFSHRDVITLMNKALDLPSVPDWVWVTDDVPEDTNLDAEMQDALLVRKGVCHQLAQGPLPSLSGSSADCAKTAKQDMSVVERMMTARNEEELSKKFNAIFDDLCFGDPINSKGWFDASQCLLMKADLVADRLGLSKGFSRASGFQIPSQRVETGAKLALAELIDDQEREYERNLQGWKPYLGKDFSVYIRHQWASFPSLRACFEELGACGYRGILDGSAMDDDDFSAHMWKEIGDLYEKGDYGGWQQAWGGLFVGALRKMAVRCTFLALYLLRRQDSALSSESFLASEISESLGVVYYTDLMGSQMYGYPLHVMTDHWKRQMAETARSCFQFAMDTLGVPASEGDKEAKQTWDLVFMRGKCHEKIASTYKREAFHDRQLPKRDEREAIRAYERHMKQALGDYATSYKEAKVIHDEGGFTDIEAGGSSQGVTEVFYRLHASRLKCLLVAASQREEELEEAELEALSLTTMHWYLSPPADSASGNTRDRVWMVLADIVSALAQCRIEQPYFHRSVYRHAQALMWAPVFYDPVAGIADGSLGFVPATKSHLLRGLNSTTACVDSAEVVIHPLFEKKRAQLCAVWVTNGGMGQSPFSLLNNSVRKYDSLRGKYISAYVDTLRLCKRKSKLEALLLSAGSVVRDLPSFYQASALSEGGPPALPHTKESLLKGRSLASLGFLRNVKREANRAIASILQEVSLESAKSNDDTLKASYVCFLRLNCTMDELRKTRAWKFGNIPEVDALCRSYLARNDHKDVHAGESNWTGKGQKTAILQAALEKCRVLFPSVPLYGQHKASAKRSRKSSAAMPSPKPSSASSQKRASVKHVLLEHKEPGGSVSYVVSVPDGLSAGDKFDTTVELEGGTMKKIRLTVPVGSPQKLKFSLSLPATDDNSGSVQNG